MPASSHPAGRGQPTDGPTGSGAVAAWGSVPADLVSHPRYELLGVLGAGGMGTVYKARHRLMGRLVALKVINPHLLGDQQMAARFRREVQAAALLAHPNIVAAYDADQAGATHFLVMEYVEGTDLDRVLAERGRLPVKEACAYARQVALGLQHAFERGMVHRDIKPHNLMLTPGGQVKVLDFGLARFASEAGLGGRVVPEGPPAFAGLPGDSAVTLPHLVSAAGQAGSSYGMGTADYMAPEEILDAHRADVRADIYSLGCTLYRFVTGQVPFPGGTVRDKLRGHLERDPAPAADLCPDVPPRLAAVLGRMLAKAPGRRPQTPAEVAQALAPFAAEGASHVLVVDDDPDARRCLAVVLEGEGYTVTTAANGREALDQLRGGPLPGLILLDLTMPVMNGLEFLQEQQRDPALAGIPVVVVSATDQRQARAAALGAADYLQKPVMIEELARKVQRHTRPE